MTTTTTLATLAHRYVLARRRRGELALITAENHGWALSTLTRSYGRRPVPNLSPIAIGRWLEDTSHHAPSTRRFLFSVVGGFTRWLVAEGHITVDPLTTFTAPQQPRSVPRAMSEPDVAAVFDVCPDQRARTIVALMVGCGLRCVEVTRLGVTDWDREASTIRVRGKGGHVRELPVPTMVTDELARYVEGRGPLIRNHNKPWRGLAPSTVSRQVSDWFTTAGLKTSRHDGRSAHALRHTAASDVLDQCGDLRIVQAMLGHQQLATTSIYLRRASLGQMREAMEGRRYAA